MTILNVQVFFSVLPDFKTSVNLRLMNLLIKRYGYYVFMKGAIRFVRHFIT